MVCDADISFRVPLLVNLGNEVDILTRRMRRAIVADQVLLKGETANNLIVRIEHRDCAFCSRTCEATEGWGPWTRKLILSPNCRYRGTRAKGETEIPRRTIR